MHLKEIKYLISIILLMLCACGTPGNPTFGPITQDDFQEQFLVSVEDKHQQIVFYSRAIWYPNKNGFKFLPAGKKSRKGIIVSTDQGIYFSKWNKNGYTTEFSARYDQIEMARHAANELLGRVVIKKDKYNSFEIMGIDGPNIPNAEQTKILYKIVQQRLGS